MNTNIPHTQAHSAPFFKSDEDLNFRINGHTKRMNTHCAGGKDLITHYYHLMWCDEPNLKETRVAGTCCLAGSQTR